MSLLAPLFLAGIFAVVLPWWLHRLSRDNPPLQDFGSSMFLEPRETTSSKQTQLRYKKLFSLRFLLLALLALLFAEPALKIGQLIGGSDYRQILIVDTSLSQRLGDRWSQTVEQVNAQLDAASAADEIFVVSANHVFQQADGDNSIDSAREQLTQLEPGLTRLDYGQLAPAVANLIEQSTLPVKVHLFTDVQESSMPARFSDLNLDGIDSFQIHSSATAADSNLAITGQLNYSADGQSDFTAIVSNYSGTAVDATVRLVGANATLEQTTLTIDGNSSAVHRFIGVDTTGSFDSGGSGTVELTVSAQSPNADQLSDDNRWLIALPDGARTEISLVQSNALANRYAAAAIASDPRYTARALEGENLSASSAGGLLIIADAAALSDRSTNKLKQYLDDGGNALLVVGSDPHAAQMRTLLNVRSATLRQSGQSSSTDTNVFRPQHIGRIDDTHPITADTSSNWRSVSILRHLPLATEDGDRVIIELADGSPLLIERSIGNGKVLVFASALKSSWNNLAVNPLFVAFMVGAVEHLSGLDNTGTDHFVGETIVLPPGAQLLNPDGQPVRDLSDIKRKGRIELTERGVYTLRSNTGTEVFSVNTDSRESDTSIMAADTVAQWQATGISSIADASNSATASDTGTATDRANNTGQTDSRSNTTDAPQATPPNTPQTTEKLKSLWPWLLAILLVLALVESLYSHRHLRIKREA